MSDVSSGVGRVSDPEGIVEGNALGLGRHAAIPGGVYNLAGPDNFRYLNLGVPWGRAQVKGIEHYELSIERARRVLGYDPQYPTKHMLANAVRLVKAGRP